MLAKATRLGELFFCEITRDYTKPEVLKKSVAASRLRSPDPLVTPLHFVSPFRSRSRAIV